ncbi:MAG: hypothetical protein SPJ78_04500 [Corynebacterium camporealensis]|uniref:hypothetical protein n=1 Tax=Corynebacterium camporealensis TaxID=161896 RepID=UPI002A91A3C9|nr:hypothetical protein [Corynebacterium camporealensis]MDY5839968.1 hypothetical protein [Corynebacterium camporealensis]
MRQNRPLAVTTALVSTAALISACGFFDDTDDAPEANEAPETTTVTSEAPAAEESQEETETTEAEEDTETSEAEEDPAPEEESDDAPEERAPVAESVNLTAPADQVSGECGTIGQLRFGADGDASCGFAANVASAAVQAEFHEVERDRRANPISKATVTATSPITGENYEMDCIVNPNGKGTTCTGADGAIVDISLTEQSYGPLVTGERPGPLYLNY